MCVLCEYAKLPLTKEAAGGRSFVQYFTRFTASAAVELRPPPHKFEHCIPQNRSLYREHQLWIGCLHFSRNYHIRTCGFPFHPPKPSSANPTVLRYQSATPYGLRQLGNGRKGRELSFYLGISREISLFGCVDRRCVCGSSFTPQSASVAKMLKSGVLEGCTLRQLGKKQKIMRELSGYLEISQEIA